jgi:hypothetical protein
MGHLMDTSCSFSVSKFGQTGRGMELTTHLHLVSTLKRLHGAIPPNTLVPIVVCTWRNFAIVDVLVKEISRHVTFHSLVQYYKIWLFICLLSFSFGTLLVAQLVEALRYKSESRGFDSRWCHWISFYWHGRTMTLGSTQPLTEMSIRNVSWG